MRHRLSSDSTSSATVMPAGVPLSATPRWYVARCASVSLRRQFSCVARCVTRSADSPLSRSLYSVHPCSTSIGRRTTRPSARTSPGSAASTSGGATKSATVTSAADGAAVAAAAAVPVATAPTVGAGAVAVSSISPVGVGIVGIVGAATAGSSDSGSGIAPPRGPGAAMARRPRRARHPRGSLEVCPSPNPEPPHALAFRNKTSPRGLGSGAS
mmetsp:Transcript_31150/g.98891  ORF Transcript_31150/g.98891 Transcript_31150/m.98891 type:complete len:213 (+) Transcript_31150:2482-3120(+)